MKMRFKVLLLVLWLLALLPLAGAFDASAPSRVTGCACETVLNPITIEHTGSQVSSYSFEQRSEGTSASAFIPSSVVVRDEATVQNELHLSCTPGNYTLTTDISSVDTKRLTQQLVVRECVTLAATSLERVTACPCSLKTHTINITNSGPYAESYSLSVESELDGVTLSTRSLDLAGQRTKPVTIFMEVPCSARGEYSVRLTAEAQRSGNTLTRESTVQVDHCVDYDVTPGALDTRDDFEKAPANHTYSMCESHSAAIPLRLTNKENYSAPFNMSLDGPAWASLDRTNLSLATGEEAVVPIRLSPGADAMGNHTLGLRVEQTQAAVSEQRSLPVMVRNCHLLTLDAPMTSINTTQSQVPLYFNNTGTQPATVSFALEAPSWISLSAMGTEDPTRGIEFGPGETRSLHLQIDPGYNRSYRNPQVNITARAEGQDIPYRYTLELTIGEHPVFGTLRGVLLRPAWVIGGMVLLALLIYLILRAVRAKGRSADEEQDRRVRRESYRITPETTQEADKRLRQETRPTRIPWRYLFLLALLALVIILVIFALYRPMPQVSQVNWTQQESPADRDGGGLVSYFSGLFAGNVTDQDEARDAAEANCTFTWPAGTDFTVNLSEYFVDPDGDPLAFSITKRPGAVNASIVGSRLRLSPSQGFSGTDTVELMAQDGQGATTSSGKLTLCVKDESPVLRSLTRNLMLYRYYILGGFGALLVIIGVLQLRERGKTADAQDTTQKGKADEDSQDKHSYKKE